MQSTLDCVTVPKVNFPRLRVPWLAAEQEASEVAGICRRETRLSGKIRKFLVKLFNPTWRSPAETPCKSWWGDRKTKEAKIMPRNECWSFICCPQCNHSNFRSWLRPVVIAAYLVVLCVALPLTVWELHKNRAQTHVVAWFIAGCFVFLTIPISVWGILQHLVNYTKPELQRRIVRYKISHQNCRIQGHLFTYHWITKVSIVVCFVLQRLPTRIIM